MKCKVCGFESSDLQEVCYYSINGDSYNEEYQIENRTQDCDALAHVLCVECADEFDFNYERSVGII